MSGALGPAGFRLRREVLYEAKPVAKLSAALRRALGGGDLDAAAFFSPRTAETFVGLVGNSDLGKACAEVTALAFSEAVAAKLRALAWREVRVAERPNQESLLARLDELASGATDAGAEETMSKGDAPDPAASTAGQPKIEAEAVTGTQRIIARFGGIRPMAGKLTVAVSTVQGWRERGAIPARHHARVLAAARAHGIGIGPDDLAGGDGPAAPPPAASPPRPETAKRGAPGPKPEPKPRSRLTVPAVSGSKSEPRTEIPSERLLEQEPASGPAIAARERPAGARAGSAHAWLGGAVLGAVALALGAAGAVAARDIWMPLVDPEYGQADTGDRMAVEQRIAMLETAQASRSALGGATVTVQSLEPLERGLAGLGEDLRTLEARVATLADTSPAGGQAGTARLAELSARVEALGALEERLGALSELAGRVDGLAGPLKAISALEQRVDALSALEVQVEELSALEARVETLSDLTARAETLSAFEAQVETLSDLKARVEALAGTRAEARAVLTGEAALTLAVQQLSAALRGSGPFTDELAFLRDVAASGALEDGAAIERTLAPLAPFAEAGIPSLEGLKAAFPAVARAVVVQSRAAAQSDWLSGALRRMSELVTLRPVGPVEGTSAGAVAARAEVYLKGDDLAAALSELEALRGPAAEAAGTWRDGAAARLAARRALTGLGRMLLARHGPAAG